MENFPIKGSVINTVTVFVVSMLGCFKFMFIGLLLTWMNRLHTFSVNVYIVDTSKTPKTWRSEKRYEISSWSSRLFDKTTEIEMVIVPWKHFAESFSFCLFLSQMNKKKKEKSKSVLHRPYSFLFLSLFTTWKRKTVKRNSANVTLDWTDSVKWKTVDFDITNAK